MRRYVTLCMTVIIGVGALVGAGCSDEDSTESKTGQLVALTIIDGAEFHAMDEGLNTPGGQIDPAWLGRVRHSQTAVASVSWPADHQAAAKTFLEAAQKLATAIEADDAVAAAPAAKAAHEAQHDLSTDSWESLATAAGIKVAAHTEATATATASPQGR